MIKALVTGVGGGIGQGVMKSLRLIKDLDIEILAADMSPKAAGLYFADRAYRVPGVQEPNYLQEILRILNEENADYYFPGTDIELPLCAENKALIERESPANVHISPVSAIQIANDKLETYRFLKQHGFPAPATWDVKDIRCMEDLPRPIIAKPRIGFRSIGVRLVEHLEDLREIIAHQKDYILQEVAGPDDQEYTCTVVAIGDECSDPVALKRTLRAGDTYRAVPVDRPEIMALLPQVARKLGVNGSCNFQLRIKDGVPLIFEINCRFSGTTPFLAQIGCNPVEYYIKKKMNLHCDWKPFEDVSILRYWAEAVVDNRFLRELGEAGTIDPEVRSTSRLR
jgi:carbamoyl-phosphate synthase large subunit